MRVWGVTGVAALLLFAAAAEAATDRQSDALARDIFRQLVEINTTGSSGSVTAAAEAMARRLRAVGYPAEDIQLAGPVPRKHNLLVRLHGSGRHRPLLLIGHLDVVEARREDWSTDPFQFVEKEGYYYGRGTQDMKDGDAIMVSALIRLKQEDFRPSRDIVLALTADEEGGSDNGVQWLLQNRPELREAQFAFNHDENSVVSEHGKPQFFEMDATEKLYADYRVTAVNPGGHSSQPVPDNAIYQLAAALGRLSQFAFPFELNTVTRAYYRQMADIESGQRASDMRAILQPIPDPAAIARLSEDPKDNSMLHTTCVATRLDGGHANNALPQRASANINCRILPGHSPEEVRETLVQAIADPGVQVQYVDFDGSVRDRATERRSFSPPPLALEVMQPLQKVVDSMWPGLRVIPTMSTGATDGVFTTAVNIPTYVIGGVQVDRDDVREHGRDERLGIKSFERGNQFYYRFLKAVCSN